MAQRRGFHIFTITFLGLFLAVATNNLHECPEPEAVYPCYCEEEDNEQLVVCNHLYKKDHIYESAKGMKGHKISRISFFMNRILEPVKSNAFEGSSAEKIVFENSTINLESPQFTGLENTLESVQLRACFNSTNPLGKWSLGHLRKLRELTIDKNRIYKFPDGWLTSAPDSLRSLYIEDNNIIRLEDNVFANIKSLTFVYLDGNRLVSVKRSVFPMPAEHLRSISLNNNKIRYLLPDFFTEMPRLSIVEINNNDLTTLDENVWSTMWSQVSKLDLGDNLFKCDSEMKWLASGQKKPMLLYGECEAPEKMKGKPFKQLKAEDFD